MTEKRPIQSLYRAIGDAERRDIENCHRCRAGLNTCEGKHFATTLAHAILWGQAYYSGDFWVLRVEIDELSFRDWTYFDYKLDGIGPAYFADHEQLDDCQIMEIRFIDKSKS